MPDGYGNGVPSYALSPRNPVDKELWEKVRELEKRLDRMDRKLERRDKKIAALERRTQ